MFISLKRVDISILVMGDASSITGYDKRNPELSNTPLHMKQDTNSIEKLKTIQHQLQLRLALPELY